MTSILISHFYNEEFLLPYWLEHHRLIFDHGIMLDYASNDSSCDIIRELTPSWEIRQSRNAMFDYIEVDKEVMDIERSIDGWKMCLNTTEFLVHSSLSEFLAKNETHGINAIRSFCVSLTERLEDLDSPITSDLLVSQKRFGSVAIDYSGTNRIPCRNRLIHSASSGEYGCGRHTTELNASVNPDLFLCHFSFCPWPQSKARKMQIINRIPPEHIKQGFGSHHALTNQELESHYKISSETSIDLWGEFPRLKWHIDRLNNQNILDKNGILR